MNRRSRIIGVACAAGLALTAALAAAQPSGYPGAVVHIRVITVGQPALGPIDFWYDPRARLWRTVNVSTSLNMYISCPARSPCMSREAPAYRQTPLDGMAGWSALQRAFVLAPPPGAPTRRLKGADGQTLLLYERTVANTGMVRQQYWVDARTGWVVRYRELVSGVPTTDERITRTVVAAGTLPRDFFSPPQATSWLQQLTDWLGARLSRPGHGG